MHVKLTRRSVVYRSPLWFIFELCMGNEINYQYGIFSFKEALFQGKITKSLELLRNEIWSDVVWTLLDEYKKALWITHHIHGDELLSGEHWYHTESDLYYVLSILDNNAFGMMNFSIDQWKPIISITDNDFFINQDVQPNINEYEYIWTTLCECLRYIENKLWKDYCLLMHRMCPEYDNVLELLIRHWYISWYAHSSECIVDSISDYNIDDEEDVDLFVSNTWNLCLFDNIDTVDPDYGNNYPKDPFYILYLNNYESDTKD